MQYDYVIVGAGLYGAVFAHEAVSKGKSCLVIDKRNHIGGNCYTEEVNGIQVHRYGAHIFHTKDKTVWDYMNQFGEFNHYINSPVARYKNELYNLPFNMNTFHQIWGVITPDEALKKLEEQRREASAFSEAPQNLEEQALTLVGRDIYEKLVKEYTEKQWGKKCTELPAFIIKRLPLRFTYDNNYFDDPYQGIPKDGYTAIIEKMLKGSDLLLNTDYFDWKKENPSVASKVIFSGAVDEYFGYKLGTLEYRSLRFETECLETDNFQGNAVVNYTGGDVPFTRIIEHKHFVFGKQKGTVITREYPEGWTRGKEPYYPVNDEKNNALYSEYKKLAMAENNVLFGGRLGSYRYYNMDQVAAQALCDFRESEAGI